MADFRGRCPSPSKLLTTTLPIPFTFFKTSDLILTMSKLTGTRCPGDVFTRRTTLLTSAAIVRLRINQVQGRTLGLFYDCVGGLVERGIGPCRQSTYPRPRWAMQLRSEYAAAASESAEELQTFIERNSTESNLPGPGRFAWEFVRHAGGKLGETNMTYDGEARVTGPGGDFTVNRCSRTSGNTELSRDKDPWGGGISDLRTTSRTRKNERQFISCLKKLLDYTVYVGQHTYISGLTSLTISKALACSQRSEMLLTVFSTGKIAVADILFAEYLYYS